MTHTVEPYYSITKDVQQQRLAEQMVPEHENGEPLLGYCHENALALATEFAERGYSPQIVWGAIRDPDLLPPDVEMDTYTVEDCEQSGIVHFWIEIPGENSEPLVCEISCETTVDGSVERGDAIVVRGRPDDYYVPENSHIRYEDVLTPDDLLSLEHYYDLVHRGLIIGR